MRRYILSTLIVSLLAFAYWPLTGTAEADVGSAFLEQAKKMIGPPETLRLRQRLEELQKEVDRLQEENRNRWKNYQDELPRRRVVG